MKIGLPKYKVNDTATQRKLSTKENVNWAESVLGIPDIWSKTQGEGIKVAVLDTGIDIDHQDLKDAIIATKDFTGQGIEDKSGHGTHCAGIIGARLNNVGFIGVAPKCKLVIGKVLGNDGSGSYDWIARAVHWASAIEKVDIISMSLGGPASTPQFYTAIHNALARGTSFVVAAGNEGSIFQNSIGYPGKYGSVITIASHDHNGNRSGFSSCGGEIDFMAPGSDIWSTYKNGGYASLSGTSMATPFVAGLAALIMASGASVANCEDLRNELMRMATHPGYHDNTTGYGPLQPFAYFG